MSTSSLDLLALLNHGSQQSQNRVAGHEPVSSAPRKWRWRYQGEAAVSLRTAARGGGGDPGEGTKVAR